MSLSPTQRTLRELRGQGRIVDVVERWIVNPCVPGGGFRKDLFGFVDLLVLDRQKGFVGIQSCGNSFKKHFDKITNSECTEYAIEWLECGGYIELWSWRKVKLKRGGKAMVWRPRIKEFTISDFGPRKDYF